MANIKDSLGIEKLNQHNYENWKFKIQMMLIKEDLSDLITNDPPETITDAWRKRDNKARALINLVIEDSQICHVRNLTTAKQTWIALKNIHERSNLSSKLYLLRKLYNTKLDERGNMIDHITKILQIVDRLRAIGEEISNSHLSAILLCSVPQSYDSLITALEARPENELSPEFIRSKLTDEYQRRAENSQTFNNSIKAFQTNKRNNYNNNYRKENKYCSHCKLRNHNREDCWRLKKQNNSNYQNPRYKGNQGYQGNKPNKQNTSSLVYNQNNEHKDRNDQNNKNSNSVDQTSSKMKNLAMLASQAQKQTWIIDSGSSAHIAYDQNMFTNITDTNKSEVVIANGKTLTSYGSGNIELETKTSDGIINKITLTNVLYVPKIETNLLSVNQAAQNGCTIVFRKDNCQIMHKGKTYLEGKLKNNLYEVELNDTQNTNKVYLTNSCDSTNCIQVWHKRLGHRNFNSIKEIISKNLAIGIELHKCTHETTCENCVKTKLTNDPYPKIAQNRATQILELVHSDVCGPIQTPTIGGKTYFLTLIDDFSRYTFIYLLNKKSEATEKIREYIAMVRNKFGKMPQSLRTDNGGEYTSTELENYLKDNGINRQFTVPFCPSQNGVAERKNRSLIEMTRAMISEAGLPHKFWGEAISSANYIQNRIPTKANDLTPYELWTKRKPDLSTLKIFGCKAYTYIDKHKRNKLDNKAEEGIFVGYDNRSKGYRIYTHGNNITIARTVKFFENIFPYKENKSEEKTFFDNDIPNKILTQNTCEEKDKNLVEIQMLDSSEKIEQEPNEQQLRRSERSNRGIPPDRLIYLTKHTNIEEPKDYKEVLDMQNPVEKEYWHKAMDDEIKSLKQNETWTLVDPPPGRKVIGSKWTFKIKQNSRGEIEKYKARLVAKGFSQRYGEDYDETFAPVVSHTTIRALLTAAAYKNLHVNHLDIKTAFLHGDLSEEVYMAQPDGYIDPKNQNKVCKLQKAIYGLKQAARAWHTKIGKFLEKLQFVQSTADQCLFKKGKGKDIIYLIVYVDDILIVGTKEQIAEITKQLSNEYELKDLGEVNHYLGINIQKNEAGQYTLNQKAKIEEIVNKFNLQESKPCDTPMETGYLKLEDDENIMQNNTKYRQAVGALLYIASITRPDITAPVNILSRRNENPRQKDWEAVKRLIRYLNNTKHLNLLINPQEKPILTSYADADWGGDKSDRKSTTGNLFLLGSTPISWMSKKQSSVALSSAEAEYISAANASQEIQWLINLLNDLDLPQELPITLYEDNQSCIKMIESQKHTSRTKHIDIKFHCIRNLKEAGIIDLKYCPSELMTADIMTKPLPKPAFQRHRDKLQLLPNDV